MSDDNSNGHAKNGGRVETAPAFALRCLSIPAGAAEIVRFLDYSANGCFTHYVRSRSHYCPGRICECQYKNKYTRTWKGYAAVQVWVEARNRWKPECLEITECLEQDFRNVCRRGQTWEIFRLVTGSSRKAEPVQGRLLEENDGDKLPPPFNFLPVVQQLYHSLEVRLEWPNPMPPKIYLQEQEGDAPAILARREVPLPPDQQDFSAEAFERAKQAAREKKSPKAEKATRGY